MATSIARSPPTQTAIVWRCPHCTLHNSSSDPRCAACGFLRRTGSRRRRRGAVSEQPIRSGLGWNLAKLVGGTVYAAVGLATGHVASVLAGQGKILGVAVTLTLGFKVLRMTSRFVRYAARTGSPVPRLPSASLDALQAHFGRRAPSLVTQEERALLQYLQRPGQSSVESQYRMRVLTALLQLERQQRDAAAQQGATAADNPLYVPSPSAALLDLLIDNLSYEELYQIFGGPAPPRTLSPRSINTLPQTTITRSDLCSDSPSCPVCLENFAVGDKARILPSCDHRFHSACIDQWLACRANCPVCRKTAVPSPDAPSSPATLAGLDA